MFLILDNKPNGNKYPPRLFKTHLSIIGSIDDDSSPRRWMHLKKAERHSTGLTSSMTSRRLVPNDEFQF